MFLDHAYDMRILGQPTAWNLLTLLWLIIRQAGWGWWSN